MCGMNINTGDGNLIACHDILTLWGSGINYSFFNPVVLL